MGQFINYGYINNIPQDTLALSKDQGLARSSINYVLKKSEHIFTLQSPLSIQSGLLEWFKELSTALDSCFHKNTKYFEYKEHIVNLIANDNSLKRTHNIGAQAGIFSYGFQAQQNTQWTEEQAISQLKNTISTIISVVDEMKKTVGIHDQESILSAQRNEKIASELRTTSINNKKIFIVHGHNEGMKQGVARFIEKNKLEPIILDEQANQGNVLIEKFEKNSDVGYAIVLCSGDDIGYAKDTPDAAKPRARQNVVFELGYFFAKLGRGRVAVLVEENVALEKPSDISGIVYIGYDSQEAWKLKLARELKACSYDIQSESFM